MRRSDERLIAEYAAAAEEYDRKWKFYIEATVRETLARLALRGDERVLDVGCGTGALLREVDSRYPGAKLAGIDPVAPMLAGRLAHGLGGRAAMAGRQLRRRRFLQCISLHDQPETRAGRDVARACAGRKDRDHGLVR